MPQRDTQELLSIWNTHEQRSTWREVTRRGGDKDVAQRVLDDLPAVSALDALAANRELVELLTARRWYVIRDAREAGASWSDIGKALGTSKQAAQDWYRRRIAEQAEHVGDLHDAARARQAL
jgi:Homeodomain-like domain-containing protein